MTQFSSKGKKACTKPGVKKEEQDNSCCMCMVKYIAFLITVFGLTAFSLKRFTFASSYHYTGERLETAVRDVAEDLSTFFCDRYEVSTSSELVDVFLVPGRAKVNSHKHSIVRRTGSQLFPGGLDRKNSFYLLEDSRIHVNACKKHLDVPRTFSSSADEEHFKDVIDILLFKGDDSWNKWKDSKCEDCSIKKQTVRYCDEGESHLNFHVEDRDVYYVAVTYRNDRGSAFMNVDAQLDIAKTSFDTTHARQECHMTTDCLFNLTYASDVDIVVKYSGSSVWRSFTSQCKFRVMFWVGIFAIVPAFLIMLGSFCCICILCTEKSSGQRLAQKQIVSSTSSTSDKAKLTDNMVPPAYESVPSSGSIQIV